MKFKFKKMRTELEFIRDGKMPFIDVSGASSLSDTLRVLKQLRERGEEGKEIRWGCTDPVETSFSEGEYEPKYKESTGGKDVKASIGFTWRIKKVDSQYFELVGNASTRVDLRNLNDELMGSWRSEVAQTEEQVPGCFFHIQFLDGDVYKESERWPSESIPIPRLPNFIVTPGGVIEFVVGELFQDRVIEKFPDSGAADVWGHERQKTMSKVLEWYNKCLERSSTSPWLEVKDAKPEGEL